MVTNFNQELLQSYLSKIVETRKEQEMLEGVKHGLVNQVARMIDMAVFRFSNKALEVNTCNGPVRYWLIETKAKVSRYSYSEIDVVLTFVCSPADLRGNIRLTKKEAQLVAELQKMWDDDVRHQYFYHRGAYKEAARKLSGLTHHLNCYVEMCFNYDINDFYRKEDLLSKHYCLSDLNDDADDDYSTSDLEDLMEIFKNEVIF